MSEISTREYKSYKHYNDLVGFLFMNHNVFVRSFLTNHQPCFRLQTNQYTVFKEINEETRLGKLIHDGYEKPTSRMEYSEKHYSHDSLSVFMFTQVLIMCFLLLVLNGPLKNR